MSRISYFTDMEKSVVTANFLKRGWTSATSDEDWNFYWANTQTCRSLFSAESSYRLGDYQMINHFPNHYELTRKDLMVKNIKRYKREQDKERETRERSQFNLEFVPVTFVLPADYNLFAEEYRRCPTCTWIMKPCGRSQGSGIFLVTKLSRIKKWSNEGNSASSFGRHAAVQSSAIGGGGAQPTAPPRESYVISKYIESPLLIGGKKFDLRLYVLVTSFRPIRAYLFRRGFCRFCSAKYDRSTHQMDNMLVHLTNVAIQKQGDDYNPHHGGKWSVDDLLFYIASLRGSDAADLLWQEICWVIGHSLKAVAPMMLSDPHCFECYGYDIIIDANLKPWLIEVNASPSLSTTTNTDHFLKLSLIDAILNVVLPPDGVPNAKWNKRPSAEALRGWIVLIDEEAKVGSAYARQNKANKAKSSRSDVSRNK
ncbi:polyglutamylase complex subunit TTLL1-like isoform X1 [Daphnia pulicaria]|uniref:polyglutamylase complex subunit TTLL1-like isoform X1 n=2 Tax=Daphnia pulicaria TaxID=35523 RepID=UPI001EEC9849|nr:polyglutamylase complex subunit TTLL1-like isoform X1 [Daphnia pulicaria]